MNYKIAVIYTHFPHYRSAVFAALSANDEFTFDFYYDPAGVSSTIESGASSDNHHVMRVRHWRGLLWQQQAIRLVWSDQADAYIFLGNPHILSTWVAAVLARMRRRPVFFWTHGWLRRDAGLRRLVKLIFFRLGNSLLVYGNRARELGALAGYPRERIHVIYNSLDYDAQRKAREAALSGHIETTALFPGSGDKPYFLVASRLVPELDLDLAIEALARLNRPATLVVVGEGPERAKLERLAAQLGADVQFIGAIYDETELARLFLMAAAVVSPGKVGLLAMHALAYGAPIITHGSLDHQMPEVEAITPGHTGAFFKHNDVADLAHVMSRFLEEPADEQSRDRRRAAAITRIEDDYTPEKQAQRIDAVLQTALKSAK